MSAGRKKENLTLMWYQGFTVEFYIPGLPVVHFWAVVCIILHHLFSCQAVTVPALVEVGNVKPAAHLSLQKGCPTFS